MNKRGFTLIEGMIGILVFLIGILGGFAYFYFSKSTLELEIKRKIATEICHSRMEEIRTENYNNLLNFEENNTPVSVDKINGYRDTVIEDIDENGDGKTDYKKITVKVKWNQNGKDQEIKVVSFLSPYK
ncbi:MAG TPA: type II secretion system protein [bacterium]|nr:type II secretion system protein [bacterium]